MVRILVVEDEQSLQTIIAKRLAAEGYSVDVASDGEDGLHYAEMVQYDLILLDLMLPKMDGLTVLQKLRDQKCDSLVLILTAKDAIEDKVSGLDAGADDYLAKPFSLEELLARMRSILRRQGVPKENVLTEADLILDTLKKTVIRDDKEIEMTSKEFAILEYLMRNKGHVLSREQIAEHAWNFDFDCDSNIINVYIRYLRGKIDDAFSVKLIHTVRGSGYVLKQKDPV